MSKSPEFVARTVWPPVRGPGIDPHGLGAIAAIGSADSGRFGGMDEGGDVGEDLLAAPVAGAEYTYYVALALNPDGRLAAALGGPAS